MDSQTTPHSWFEPSPVGAEAPGQDPSREIHRPWQGFMTARLVLGVVLVSMEAALYATGTTHSRASTFISVAYLLATIVSKWFIPPRPLGQSFSKSWGALVGIDLLTFTALQLMQDAGSTISYTPLFALPVLVASVLGSLRLALGTAAGITVLMLLNSFSSYLGGGGYGAPYFAQSALSGMGYFAMAWLANQLATRLASEGQRARRSQLAAHIQRQVNELVIESLPDGVLIVDERGCVRAANPAARQLLGSRQALHDNIFDLKDEPGWRPLLDLMRLSVGTGSNREEDVTIRHGQQGPLRLHARTRLAAAQGLSGESLCVIFLQDQREIEARLRTEKLAGMGRLSTAVAHEIRNPLAAIAQANALLDEDITDPRLKRLTAMVDQNAKRLEKTVHDILNVSRVQPHEPGHMLPAVSLASCVQRIASDWADQCASRLRLHQELGDQTTCVRFETEHLRRVLVNLLDNALRYTENQVDTIQVIASTSEAQLPTLSVWSEAPPLDQSVERHLFEPFFSSDSRSSGLGLYICRELCERHGATISYLRSLRSARGTLRDGNEFVIVFQRASAVGTVAAADNYTTPWQQPTLY